MSSPQWTDEESRALDRGIRAERRRAERAAKRPKAISKSSAHSTIDYTRGVARGGASDDELQRRARMDRAMNRRKRGSS